MRMQHLQITLPFSAKLEGYDKGPMHGSFKHCQKDIIHVAIHASHSSSCAYSKKVTLLRGRLLGFAHLLFNHET